MFEAKSNVLVYAHIAPPVNGVTLMSEEVISALKRYNYNPIVINLGLSNNLNDIGSFDISKVLSYFRIQLRIFLSILKFRPKIIYATFPPNGLSFLKETPLILVAKLFGIKIITHIHGRGLTKIKSYKYMYQFLYSDLIRIHLSTSLFKENVRFINKNSCDYILPNGLKDEGSICMKRNNKKDFKIVYFGNISKEKGILDFLATIEKVLHIDNTIRVEIAGKFISTKIEELVKDIINSSEYLREKVCLYGPKYKENKLDFFADADLLFYPSYNDAMPLVIIEAYMMSLPVLAYKEGGIQDMLVNEVFLLEKGDIDTAVKRIVQYVQTSKEVKQKYRNLVREHYAKNWNINLFEEKFYNIIKNI